MRILILSDVHANLAALEAVLRDAQARGPIDSLWCLGDTVGYGPQPSQCISRLREAATATLAGNHDRAGTGAIGTEEFNPDAARAAEWTRGQLSPEDAAYLDALPEVAYLKPGREGEVDISEADFTAVHGTLRWPIWEYLYSHETANAHLERQRTPFSLVGHTHMPMLIAEGEEFPHGCELFRLEDGAMVQLGRQRKVVVNPGGVGQPRDGDPRASYAVFDSGSDTIALHRVEYDIQATQRLMDAAGLPRWLIERLALGR